MSQPLTEPYDGGSRVIALLRTGGDHGNASYLYDQGWSRGSRAAPMLPHMMLLAMGKLSQGQIGKGWRVRDMSHAAESISREN
jgi:hypothetical protein